MICPYASEGGTTTLRVPPADIRSQNAADVRAYSAMQPFQGQRGHEGQDQEMASCRVPIPKTLCSRHGFHHAAHHVGRGPGCGCIEALLVQCRGMLVMFLQLLLLLLLVWFLAAVSAVSQMLLLSFILVVVGAELS